MLPDSPQQNGIAEHRIGRVMDVARTSMMHAAAPHFLWPFAVRYAAHQINLHPRVSRPETSPALLWTGKVGDASAFRVWGSRAFVRDLSADKLSPRAAPCVFLGFPPDAPEWQFYHRTSRRVLSSLDVTFDESVPYYRLFPYRTPSLPPPPALPYAVEPVEVTGDSGAAGGADSGGAEPGDAATGGAKPGGAEPGGAEPGGALPGGDELRGAPPGGSPGASSLREPLSPQELREWFTRRWRRAAGAGGSSATEGATVAGPGGARTVSTGAAGPASSTGAGAAEGVGTETTAGGPAWGTPGAAGGSGAAGGAAGEGAPAGGPGAVPTVSSVAARPRPYFVPLQEQVLGSPPSTGLPPSLDCPQPVQSQLQLQPPSPLPAPSPYTGPTGGLAERREPASRPASPVRAARTSGRGSRQRPPPVPGTHRMSLRLSTAPLRVPLPSPPESSLPALTDPESDSLRAASPTVTRLLATVVTEPSFESTAASALVTELVDFAASCRLDYAASLVTESEPVCPPSVGGECALGTDVLEDRQEEFQCLAAASPHLVSTLLTPEGDLDALDIPTPRSYSEAIEGPYSSQWQAAMDVEMASWKSTGTYVDAVPPPGANIVSGMWIFRVKRPPGSPPVFKARYVARGFSQRQGGSLHKEIWLCCPLGFTGTFPPGIQWSLRQPVYGLRQAPCEWHDTLRTTLAALGFAPSTADPSLFLRTDISLPPFYILVYVLQRFGFTYSSPQATPLPTRHSLSALPSDESVESSGPYPELVGCLMYLMTCTRPDLAYPLSILSRYVAPGRHRPEHMAVAKRVLRYLCSTSGMGLVLGGRSPVVLTGHADASWDDDQATRRPSQGHTFSLGSGSVSWRATRSSSVLGSKCEAEIYAGAMAAQELRWLTYLLTDLGEPPRSPPVLPKHIALRYFLARELQQRGQLRLAYVASEANTSDVFTKALAPCDHQRFCTQLGLFSQDGTGRMCKLKKSIYGLKQAPRCWYQKLVAVLEEMGFRTSSCDESLFLKGEGEKLVLFLVYVDDILLFSSSMKEIQKVQQQLMKNFKCKTLGEVKYYLRMHVERDLDHRWLKLHQEKFIKELGRRVEVLKEKGELLGEGKLFLTCFTDATWASEKDDSSSVGGYICVVGGGPVSWRSKKQTETALSSVESEYMALFHGVKDVIWLRRLLEEIGQEQKVATPLFCDSKGALGMARNAVLHGLNKHMRIKWHWLRKEVKRGTVNPIYIKTHQQPGDFLTKRLADEPHRRCMRMSGMSMN
ncbi:unnamed protein product [Closterium sp. NIES-53]